MDKPLKMLAVDLGASSGRAMLGTFDGSKIALEEVHRFSNDPVRIRSSLYWDVLRLLHEIQLGIARCIHTGHSGIASLGIDTWGVDFGLLDANGDLLGNPYHYRDTRTEGMMDEAFRRVSRREIYEQTGIQMIWFNTLYQLLAMKTGRSPQLDKARTLLLMPDLLNYFLTGEKFSEFSIATTTQLYNPVKGDWAFDLIRRMEIPEDLFTPVVDPGTIIGKLSGDTAEELGSGTVPVVSVAAHDTGSAVAAVPAESENFAYISCGTWSLMGVEAPRPVINSQALEMNFTNEGGVGRTIRLLKNIMGLWLLQESRRQWEREGEALTFEQLGQMAASARPFVSWVNPDHPVFNTPGDMPGRIRDFCRDTGQPVPRDKGEVVQCILQSLALKYRYTLECLEKLLGRELPVIHMVGGGIQDRMLCQYTANATGRVVAAGPVEATSIGNIIVQAMALGEIADLKEARRIVRRSFPVEIYHPREASRWDDAYGQFGSLVIG